MKRILVTDQNRLRQLQYTGVTEEKLQLIYHHRNHLIPLIDTIVDELYEEIMKVEKLKKLIHEHSNLTHLKETQKEYLKECFLATINDEYIQKRYNIGLKHSEVGLELKWYLSTYTKYADIISIHLSRTIPNVALPLYNAIHALFSFDMQLTLEAYSKIELQKAAHPLRFEFEKVRQINGFTDEDVQNLNQFSGYISFQVEQIMTYFRDIFLQRIGNERVYTFVELENFFAYIKTFLLQFFQEKIYQDSEAFFRIIRDWSRVIIESKYHENFFQITGETLCDALRKVFMTKEYLANQYILQYIHSFERLTKFTLSMIHEIIRPYLFLRDFDFLEIYAYEISTIDFGRLTWTDEKMKRFVKSLGMTGDSPIGKRCYEVLHKRTVPCSGCPVLEGKQETMMTTVESVDGLHYYKVRPLPQNKIFELSRALLIIQDITRESKVMFHTIEKLLQLAEYRDDDTKNHVERIGILSGMLARLAGCDEKFVANIEIAAKFHDIGKVGIPDSILNKPGKLTNEEWDSMKTHAQIGHQILSNLDLPVIQMAASIARTHHEWWNGQGYPNGLKGEEIPLEGRIVAIVDVFDALLSKRVYKDAFPPEQVKAILMDGSGHQFDPKLIDLFIMMWDEFITTRERLLSRD
ncbi:putative two-component system response regulator [Anoxybacillus vitaminiphilus]|uniref:Putative two-component system response regulator n=1 Tax=Paranoxybacillus vitaminiphilus TaxID=581036 RepID=A0A327YF34_9BACL|nr:HD domain-containing phosphohydrolase [Anoxybacillus vitaminiphilus]RAK18425.1 putative two-component system response regulator [Anoxybacillus vitaminiphilus]